MVLLFWCRLTQVVLEKRPLHECGGGGDGGRGGRGGSCRFIDVVVDELVDLLSAGCWHHYLSGA